MIDVLPSVVGKGHLAHACMPRALFGGNQLNYLAAPRYQVVGGYPFLSKRLHAALGVKGLRRLW